jgi:long-subunit fatty acid transport protein
MKYFLIAFLLLPLAVWARPSNFGNWIIYLGDKKINKKWNWHHEVQYRNFNLLGDTEQLLVRTGIGYNLSENNNNLLIGYAFVYSEPYIAGSDNKTSSQEHRIYQQWITRQTFGNFSLQHRYRFEQRFFVNDFRLRLRYFLSMNYVIHKNPNAIRALYVSAYNEIFLNLEQNYFDRNRLYGGLGYKFSKNLRVELGVMNQSTNTVSRNQLNLITFFKF